MSPCEDYAAASFKGTNYYFCAMVFETLGGINDQGEEVVRQLFTFAAHLGREFSSYCSRGWARVSCCLQRSVAQMIANRIDGRQGELELESESMVVVAEAGGGKEEHEGEGEFEVGGPLGGEPFLGKPMVHRSLCSPSSPNPFLCSVSSPTLPFPGPFRRA